MNTQTVTHLDLFQVTKEAEGVLTLGMKKHYSFKLVTDFHGPITDPVLSRDGKRLYMPLTETDRQIIPRLAFTMHRQVRKAGFKVAQVIIGHDLVEGQRSPVSVPQVKPEVYTPAPPANPKPSIQRPNIQLPKVDWGGVAKVAGVVLAGMVGLTLLSLNALLGSVALVDPTYCICLDDGQGTVIELLSWDTEV